MFISYLEGYLYQIEIRNSTLEFFICPRLLRVVR